MVRLIILCYLVCSSVDPLQVGSYEFTLVRTHTCNQFFSFFFQIMYKDGNVETKKCDRKGFFRKRGKKGPKIEVFFSFHEINLLIGENNLRPSFSVQIRNIKKFCFASHVPKSSCPSRLQDSLIIITSGNNVSISLIFAWRYSPRQVSIWDYNFCLGVSMYVQSCLNLPRLARGHCQVRKIQNERLINF